MPLKSLQVEWSQQGKTGCAVARPDVALKLVVIPAKRWMQCPVGGKEVQGEVTGAKS